MCDYTDKESSEDFIHGLFEFLFSLKKGGNADIADLQKEWYSLQRYLATLIYGTVGDEKTSQEATEKFFDALKQLARLLTEYAHNKTGIDIHSGAVIGSYFFIDHGTGIVIGETAIIGSHIEDDVVIYANATILGGNTIVHSGTVIDANVWVGIKTSFGTVAK
jgi:serine acetyltransferase